jgi:hypothetical protein
LRQAARVLRDHALAFQVRGHAQQRADGDHARAAHAATTMPQACSATGSTGSGMGQADGLLPLGLLELPPSTVTKLGQKPFTQE